MELSELSSYQEASLSCSGLEEWQEGPQVLTYGAILICRKGKARLNVNYKDWELYEGAVITLFPNDVVELKVDGDCKSPQTENGDCKSPQTANSFQVEILKYNPSLLREASLQLEQTVYSSLREDRCRQDTPVVTNIINGMFGLLKVYFDQSECTCISQLVLCQLKAFFIGFHEYLQRNPEMPPKYKGQISCSCRTAEEVLMHKKKFDYVFLSSAFTSPKCDDEPVLMNMQQIKQLSQQKVIDKKVYAFGGVQLDNIKQAKDLGFGGVVVLGDIWNRFSMHSTQDFKDLIQHFRKLRRAAE